MAEILGRGIDLKGEAWLRLALTMPGSVVDGICRCSDLLGINVLESP
jgi:hypothetical protein